MMFFIDFGIALSLLFIILFLLLNAFPCALNVYFFICNKNKVILYYYFLNECFFLPTVGIVNRNSAIRMMKSLE